MSKKLFITGTGTDIGKTYISGLILKKLNEITPDSAYYKAAISGNERGSDGKLIPGDAVYVKKTSGIAQEISTMCPYVYEHAVSPHLAAKLEGHPVDMSFVLSGLKELEKGYEYILMEGSGGIICPLRFDNIRIQLEDFIKAAGSDCLIVADAGLGTINSVVLTAEYMKNHGLKAKGIIFNNFDPESILHNDNIKMCEALTGIKVICTVKNGATELPMEKEQLLELFND